LQEIKAKPWLAGHNEAKRSRNIAQKVKKGLVSPDTIDDTETTKKPQKSSVDVIPSHLPIGTLSSGEFAKQHGIEYDHMKNYMRRGVNGERFEVTEVPHPTREGYTLKFLTPEQAQKAIDILKRH